MKKYFVISLFLGIFSSYAQQKVGIGTDAPTRTLDINGELRVRDLVEHKSKEGLRYLTADKDGNIGSYAVDVDYVGLDSKEAGKKDEVNPRSGNIATIKLTGMEITATIPAHKRIVLIVSYSLPIGSPLRTIYSAYFGVRLYGKISKEGESTPATAEIIPEMTRKFTTTNAGDVWDMISITNQYVKKFEAEDKVRTVTFYLEGFVDKLGSNKMRNVQFNMYGTGTENYNWGHAYMTYETLELKAN